MTLKEDYGSTIQGITKHCFTYERRPVKLKYYEVTHDIKKAILREKQLKGWSRKKKQALFKEDWEELKNYQNNLRKTGQPFDKLRVTALLLFLYH